MITDENGSTPGTEVVFDSGDFAGTEGASLGATGLMNNCLEAGVCEAGNQGGSKEDGEDCECVHDC